MKSYSNINLIPASKPILSDDLIEFHAARVLLLVKNCGTNNSISGLTKMAKLDFFVRYPKFFAEVCKRMNHNIHFTDTDNIESLMVRHHYGPWDKRYYRVLSYLKSKKLILIYKKGPTTEIAITGMGEVVSKELEKSISYESLVKHMKVVKKVFGRKSGNYLKSLIYNTFEKEITEKGLGEIIQ